MMKRKIKFFDLTKQYKSISKEPPENFLFRSEIKKFITNPKNII